MSRTVLSDCFDATKIYALVATRTRSIEKIAAGPDRLENNQFEQKMVELLKTPRVPFSLKFDVHGYFTDQEKEPKKIDEFSLFDLLSLDKT